MAQKVSVNFKDLFDLTYLIIALTRSQDVNKIIGHMLTIFRISFKFGFREF